MASKKILPHVAQEMFDEEMAPIREAKRIASEEEACYAQLAKEESERIKKETDFSWRVREQGKVMDEQCFEPAEVAREVELYEETLVTSDAVDPNTATQLAKRNRAYRRKQNARSNRKMRRNAKDAMNNMHKRAVDDMQKTTRRGGQTVQMPKSLSIKTARIWTDAATRKLVDTDPV